MYNFGATPNYGGYPSYQNYGYQQQRMPQQQQPQMVMNQQPMQYDFPIREIKFVTGDEAKAYIVMPNTSSLLIDKIQGIAYLKSADNMGQSFMMAYDFKPHTNEQPKQEQPQIKLEDYMRKEDLEQYGFVTSKELEKILTRIEKLENTPKVQNVGVKSNVATKQ